jgi:trk system potassium uptake protein TrkH
MLLGGLNFIELIRCFRAGIRGFFQNVQIKSYFSLIILFSFIVIVSCVIKTGNALSLKKAMHNIFNTVSCVTTTGFDLSFSSFPVPFFKVILLVLAMGGGCSGSTTGGVKIFRLQILFSVLRYHFQSIMRPSLVSPARYQGRVVQNELIISVVSYFILLVCCFVISFLLIGLKENNATIGIGATYSCLFNIGVPIDIFSNTKFAISNLSTISKATLIIDMIIGRLEIIPFIVVFSKSFWK